MTYYTSQHGRIPGKNCMVCTARLHHAMPCACPSRMPDKKQPLLCNVCAPYYGDLHTDCILKYPKVCRKCFKSHPKILLEFERIPGSVNTKRWVLAFDVPDHLKDLVKDARKKAIPSQRR